MRYLILAAAIALSAGCSPSAHLKYDWINQQYERMMTEAAGDPVKERAAIDWKAAEYDKVRNEESDFTAEEIIFWGSVALNMILGTPHAKRGLVGMTRRRKGATVATPT